MSDLNRKQFEKWFDESGFYKFKETAWAAWEASRECLVIELPDVSDMTERAANGNCYSAARLDQHSLVIKYIHASGVKTK